MPSLWPRLLVVSCAALGSSGLAAPTEAQVPVKKIQIGGAARNLRITAVPVLQSVSTFSAVSEVHLLRLDYVQEELEVVAEQSEKLAELFRKNDEATRKSWDALRDLSPQERLKKSAEIRQENAKRLEELRKQARDVLLPHQQEKLDQIVFRTRAQSALANSRLLDQLGVDDEQKTALGRLRAELAESVRRLQREMVEKSLEVLTPEQRQQLKDMGSR